MDLAALGVVLGAVGTIFSVVLAFALNAAKQQQAVFESNIKTLREDRDYYRKELRESEKHFNSKLSDIEARYDLLKKNTEAEREANHRAIEGLNETVDDCSRS